ncbi:LON-domain-containing protein, partial [Macrolepiota fuliginosa MF-IS2]
MLAVASCALYRRYKISTSSFLMKLYDRAHDLSGLTGLAELGGIRWADLATLSRRFYSGTQHSLNTRGQATVALGYLRPWVEQVLAQPYLWGNGVWNLEVCVNKKFALEQHEATGDRMSLEPGGAPVDVVCGYRINDGRNCIMGTLLLYVTSRSPLGTFGMWAKSYGQKEAVYTASKVVVMTIVAHTANRSDTEEGRVETKSRVVCTKGRTGIWRGGDDQGVVLQAAVLVSVNTCPWTLQSSIGGRHKMCIRYNPSDGVGPASSLTAPRWVNSKNPPEDSLEHDPEQSESEGQKPEDKKPNEPQPSSSSSSSSTSPAASDSNSPPQPADSPPPSNSNLGSIAKRSVPEIYPQVLALPIARRPLFPGFYKAVVVRNPAVVAAIKDMMKRGQPYLGAFLLKDEHTDGDIITDINSVHQVGVFAQVTNIPTPPPTPDPEVGPLQTSFLHNHAVSIVNVENLETQPYNKDDQCIRAFMSEIVSVFKDIAQLNPLFRDQITNFSINQVASNITNFSINQVASNVFDEPDKLADFAAAVSTGEVHELQDVLESLVVDDRLRKSLLVLKKELINAQLQSKLARDVDSKIAKRQREYYLMEQLKGIKKELGMESDGKDKLIEKFRERAKGLKMPEGVRKVFDEELAKLQGLEPAASEANVTRNYLDWLTQIPWGQHTPENYSLTHAKQVLNEDHYGLTDVKSRILEFLAVGKLRGTVQGKIICLVGPPGVGKTSIGK